MKAKPVRKCKMPAYPTRLEILADPKLLAENLPQGWRVRPELAGAVAAFLAANCFINTGCQSLPSGKAAIVAPIFKHGEGRGATGCVAVSPPVFLSEEEALQVITEELKVAGVQISAKNVELKGVTIPQHDEMASYRRTTSGGKEEPNKERPLHVSLLDQKHSVAVEFVSSADYFQLGGAGSGGSSVQSYQFEQVAEQVAKKVAEEGKGVYFGAFYDPVPKVDWKSTYQAKDREAAWKKVQAEATVESKRLLREQVKDFVDWLKGQGVI